MPLAARQAGRLFALDDMHPVVLLKLRGGAAPLVHAASPTLSLLLQLRGGGSVAHAAPGAGLALASLLMKNMIGAGIFALFTALTSTNTGLLPGLAILAALSAASLQKCSNGVSSCSQRSCLGRAPGTSLSRKCEQDRKGPSTNPRSSTNPRRSHCEAFSPHCSSAVRGRGVGLRESFATPPPRSAV